jgi:hypothetical protein
MKKETIKQVLIPAFALMFLFNLSCGEQPATLTNASTIADSIFPKGDLALAENFTGKAWNIGLVANDTRQATTIF